MHRISIPGSDGRKLQDLETDNVCGLFSIGSAHV